MKVDLSSFRISLAQYKLAITAFAILIILALSTYVLSHKEITLRVDGQTTTVVTRARNVSGVLSEADIKVSPHDRVEPAPNAPIDSGILVSIDRAVPITLEVNGFKRRFWTTAKTVGQVVEGDLGLSLRADIGLDPAADIRLTKGQVLSVKLFNRRVETVEAELPFTTERRDNSRLTKGRTRVAVAGKPGTKKMIVEHLWVGNAEVDKVVRDESVLAEPVTQVVQVGTMVPRVAAVNFGSISRGGRSLTMMASAYAAGTGGAGWRTATGTGVYKGIVAVDPRVIPLGTKLYIDGYGPAIAADTGGAIKGNRIDLGFGSAGEAIQFGRRTVTVHIQ